MLKNTSLRMKLMTGFALVAIIAAVIGGVGVTNLKKLAAADNRMFEMMTVPLAQIDDISTAFQRMRCNLLELQFADSNAKINDLGKRIADREKEIAENIPMFEKTLLTEEGQKLTKDLKENLDKYEYLQKKICILDKRRKEKRRIGFLERRNGEDQSGYTVSHS